MASRQGMQELVSEELRLLDKLSHDLDTYWQTKNGESTAIRNWRLRYRTWRRRTEASLASKSEDGWATAEKARKAFNAGLRDTWQRHYYLGDDDLQEQEAILVEYSPRYADEIKQARKTFNSETAKWDDDQLAQMDTHEKKREKVAKDAEDEIVGLAEGYHIATVENDDKKKKLHLYINTDEVESYATMAVDRASEYGAYGEVQAYACTKTATVLAKKYLERDMYAQAVDAVVEGTKAMLKDFEKVFKKDTWEPKSYEPKLYFLEPYKAPAEGPDLRLLDEMEKYARGPYDAARGHLSDINDLVQKIGFGCPYIDIPADSAQESAQTAVSKDIEALKDVMDRFGQQDHGHKRTALIEPLRESLDALLGSYSKRTQKRHIEHFRAYASALSTWVRLAWTQFGGTPQNAKEAKYKKMASGK